MTPSSKVTLADLFMLKTPFILELFLFLVMQKNNLIRKLRLTSEAMTPQTGQELITIHIVSNISRSKGKQATKFCQLRKYNVTNIFLPKS